MRQGGNQPGRLAPADQTKMRHIEADTLEVPTRVSPRRGYSRIVA